MHTYLTNYLACPVCHGNLSWDLTEGSHDRIQTAQILCEECRGDYFVRVGIGIFLTPDLPRNDLWERADTELMKYLNAHPDIERQLMDSSLEVLSPADQFFRAMVMEERGDFIGARVVEKLAHEGLYAPEYLACLESQMDFVLDYLRDADSPVLDLASGRGYLVEKMVQYLQAPIIASDFSLRVLRRNLGWFESAGIYDRISLLAFDARKTPFKNKSIQFMTTNLGLANIEQPGSLLKELRRIVSLKFLAVSHCYPESDHANWKAIRELGLDERMLNLRAALRLFVQSGWQVGVANRCVGIARPTPPGTILEGARIDSLPVAETRLEWCVLSANGQ